MVKNDDEYIYKMEDKGSCIVRMKKEDYEKNVESHLDKPEMYENVELLSGRGVRLACVLRRIPLPLGLTRLVSCQGVFRSIRS